MQFCEKPAISEKNALVSFSRTTNSTRPSDSCYFEDFEKLTCACFFPNCTRNHAITYTINTAIVTPNIGIILINSTFRLGLSILNIPDDDLNRSKRKIY